MDLLHAVNIEQEPLGVRQTVGMCDNRAIRIDEEGNPVYGSADVAYSITQTAVLTVTTSQLFTGEKHFTERLHESENNCNYHSLKLFITILIH